MEEAPNSPLRPRTFKVLLPPAEAKQLDKYIDSQAFSAGQITGQMARRVLQPQLLNSLNAMKREHLTRVRQLAAQESSTPGGPGKPKSV